MIQKNTQKMKFLGEGMYARAYDLGDGRIVKRSKHEYADVLDPTYFYLKWVVDTMAWNRYSCAPRVHALELVPDTNEYWVVMEKLKHLSDRESDRWRDRGSQYHYSNLLYDNRKTPMDEIGMMLVEFYNEVPMYRHCFDLHADNVMLRGSVLVVTDPFS